MNQWSLVAVHSAPGTPSPERSASFLVEGENSEEEALCNKGGASNMAESDSIEGEPGHAELHVIDKSSSCTRNVEVDVKPEIKIPETNSRHHARKTFERRAQFKC